LKAAKVLWRCQFIALATRASITMVLLIKITSALEVNERLVLLLSGQQVLSQVGNYHVQIGKHVIYQVDLLQRVSLCTENTDVKTSCTLQHRCSPQHPTCLQVQTGHLSHQNHGPD
jgi:hypothetical protein